MRARSPLLFASLLVATLAMITLATGCGGETRKCKSGTLFVTITLAGTSDMADEVEIAVSIDGGAAKATRLPRSNPGRIETVEVKFPNGYPTGKNLLVTVTAFQGGVEIGRQSTEVRGLVAGCATVAVDVEGHGPAGTGGSGGAGGGAAGRGGSGGAVGTGRGGTGGSAGGAGGSSGGAGGGGGVAGSVAGRGGTGGSGGAAGRGGTGGTGGGGTGGRGGSGGTGGAGGSGPPSCAVASFDTGAESFALNVFNLSSGHLLFPDGGPAATSAWNASEGNFERGSVRIDAPYNNYDQFVDLTRSFGMTTLANWGAHSKLHVRVKIASGLDHSPSSPPGVQPYVNSYNVGDGGIGYHFRNNYVTVTSGHGWADYAVDLAAREDFDPTKVTSFGVMIQTGNGQLGGGGVNPVKPTAAVIYVDSFWLEGGCTPSNCVMGLSPRPVTPLITGFADAVADPVAAGEIRYGGSGGMHGGTSRYASGPKGSLSLTTPAGALTFSASVEAPTTAVMYPFNGFVLYMDGPSCVDASAYTGVSFTISNVTGACSLLFKFTDLVHSDGALGDANRGLCSGSCFGGSYPITSSTTQVAFATAPMFAGVPATALDPSKLTDIQFQFQPAGTASCTGSFTLDDVRFY